MNTELTTIRAYMNGMKQALGLAKPKRNIPTEFCAAATDAWWTLNFKLS